MSLRDALETCLPANNPYSRVRDANRPRYYMMLSRSLADDELDTLRDALMKASGAMDVKLDTTVNPSSLWFLGVTLVEPTNGKIDVEETTKALKNGLPAAVAKNML